MDIGTTLDIGTFRGIVTALLLVLFIALVIWAFSHRRRADFDAAAQLPLEDDEAPPPAANPIARAAQVESQGTHMRSPHNRRNVKDRGHDARSDVR